ncbi:hypothetical protein ACFX5E_07415 [Flavobacterium sp. LS2P90]|uniref:Uncharacterized protein n=1 Tax=Flavobacterium xylosi TaxID=3230415 RepID=A0ABW6HVV2_9FLAO
MIRLLGKTFALLLLFITFSFVWVSDLFAILANDKKYDLCEKIEKKSEESNLENKTKTLFLTTFENVSCIEYSSFENDNINSSDLFRAKECALKNMTPPPKHG